MADADLQDRFSPNKPLEPDVLSELQSIMRLHSLSPEDLFFKWESYCIKLDTDAQIVTLEGLRNLKQSIQDELEKTQRQVHVKTERKVAATPRGGAKGGDVFGMLDGLVPSTPGSGGQVEQDACDWECVQEEDGDAQRIDELASHGIERTAEVYEWTPTYIFQRSSEPRRSC
ncbi:DNA-directed DNA polymerase alpha subunit pol12 [Fusarium solani]